MNINLHIERLVLDGVDASQPKLIETALTTEVARLLVGGNLSPLMRQGGVVPNMRVALIALAADPLTLGRDIGRAVHASISSDQVPTRSR